MNIFKNSNNKGVVIVNGVRIETNGSSNISVSNGTVYVGGEMVKDGLSGIVKVEFIGDLASLKADGSVDVQGSVKGNVDCGGSCNCGDVDGSVDSGGSTNCGNVKGDVDAGGSVRMSR